ncbi:MAG: glutathione binding-like protein [Arhodomonas sp.]|nr:glutathione binding-like protein [Arhodomonas sp.]
MLPFSIGLARTAEDERDHTVIEAGRQRTRDNFQILEVWLGNGGPEYIVGAELTVADIAIGPFLHRWLLLEPSASAEQPHLAALYQRYREHRAFQSHVMTQPF